MSIEEILNTYKRMNDLVVKLKNDLVNCKPEDRERLTMLKDNALTSIRAISEYVTNMFYDLNKEIINDQKDYVLIHQEKDNKRRSYHNNLIVSVKLLDKICEIVGLDPIYGNLGEFKDDTADLLKNELSPSASLKRREISSWALYLVTYSITNETRLTSGFVSEDQKKSEEISELYGDISSLEVDSRFENAIREM